MGIEITAAMMATAAPYISAASMAVGTASAIATYQAQQQAASNQAKANAAAAESALRARNNQQQQLTTRALQERDSASEKIMETRIQALEGEGAARAHGAGVGIEGGTIDALAREYWSKQGRAENAVGTTANNTVRQLASEVQGSQGLYEGRVNSLTEPKEPSLWGLGLGIAQPAAAATRDFVRAETRAPTTTRG